MKAVNKGRLMAQMEKVRADGGSNMFDAMGVLKVARRLGCDLVVDAVTRREYGKVLEEWFAMWKERQVDDEAIQRQEMASEQAMDERACGLAYGATDAEEADDGDR